MGEKDTLDGAYTLGGDTLTLALWGHTEDRQAGPSTDKGDGVRVSTAEEGKGARYLTLVQLHEWSMHEELDNRVLFLRDVNIEAREHFERGLLDHLLGTRQLLLERGARPVLCERRGTKWGKKRAEQTGEHR